MSKINEVIPAQRFELFRDVIAVILATEVANQFAMSPAPVLNAPVWVERFIPFSRNELPAINVVYSASDYDDNNAHTSLASSRYSIELTVSARHTASEDGDKIAGLAAQKLAGVCRYVLEHPAYLTLGLPRGYIADTEVSTLRIGAPTDAGDGMHTISAQLVFVVRHEENNGDIMPSELDNIGSTISLGDSPNGVFVELNNL